MKFHITIEIFDAIEELLSKDCSLDLKVVFQFLLKYVKYGGYIIIEFDTETQTARILEV